MHVRMCVCVWTHDFVADSVQYWPSGLCVQLFREDLEYSGTRYDLLACQYTWLDCVIVPETYYPRICMMPSCATPPSAKASGAVASAKAPADVTVAVHPKKSNTAKSAAKPAVVVEKASSPITKRQKRCRTEVVEIARRTRSFGK